MLFTSGCVNGELKRADVALAYTQILTKWLTYDLSSEEYEHAVKKLTAPLCGI